MSEEKNLPLVENSKEQPSNIKSTVKTFPSDELVSGQPELSIFNPPLRTGSSTKEIMEAPHQLRRSNHYLENNLKII